MMAPSYRHVVLALSAFALAPLPTVAIGQAPANSSTVLRPPGLNHLYVVLDAETFVAMRDDVALREAMGRSDGGLPDYAAPAMDADRIFFRGKTTYVEFFAPDNRFGEPVGKVGIAVAADTDNDFAHLSSAWRAHCGSRFRTSEVTWRRTLPEVPWYDAVQCDDTAAGARIALWAMTYRPEFASWQTNTDTATTRAAILAPRRANGQGRFDVSSVVINVIAEDHDRLAPQFEAAGMVRSDSAEGTRLAGDGWNLLLRLVDADPGLASMALETKGDMDRSLELGGARLDPDEKGAVLRFAPSGRSLSPQ